MTAVEPGFADTVTFSRRGAASGRDDQGRPTYGVPTVVAAAVSCAAGAVAESRKELGGAHGGETTQATVAVHVALGTDVAQADSAQILSGPWAGWYNVVVVKALAIHLRVLLEAASA